VCEKGVIENRLNKENDRFDEVEREIESIKTLAESIRNNGLVQPITVWRGNMTNYPIVSGHRRYYAICYLYGRMVKIKTKIYPAKPLNVHILRHVENFARVDLAPSDAIRSYQSAMEDLKNVITDIKSAIKRKDIVTSNLGISKSQYYRFEKLTEYYDKVLPLFDGEKLTSIDSTYKDMTTLEKLGGSEMVNAYFAHIKSNSAPVKLDDYLASVSKPNKEKIKSKGGREKQYITMPKIGVKQSTAIYRLLKEDITTLDTGVHWDTLDKNDPAELEKALKLVIKVLCKNI
jgi:ParB family chromosome partitioning protein